MELFYIVAGFFVITVVVAWLVLFPTGRDVVSGSALATGSRASAFVENRFRSIARAIGVGATRLGRALYNRAQFVSHNRRLALGVALLLCVPPLVVSQLNYSMNSDGINFESGSIDKAAIERMLRGEELAPPPQPVPAVFETRQVKLIRPHLPQANRDWSLLKPEFRQRLLLIYKLMRKKYGYNMILIEGYRSPKRQRLLAKLKSGVTNAGAGESYHQYGLAADSAFMRNGELIISAESDWAMRGYRLYGKLAEAVGLTWGGEWDLHDYGHVELQKPGVLE